MNVYLRHILLCIYYSATLVFQIPEAKKTPTSKQQDPGEQLAMEFLNSQDSDDDVDCSNGDCNDDYVDIHDSKIDFDVGGDNNGDGHDGSESDSFVDGDAQDIDLVAVDSWVVVKYDEKRYVGKVTDIINGKVQVRCLKEDYGSVLDIAEYERENDAVFYDRVWKPKFIPTLNKVGRKFLLKFK